MKALAERVRYVGSSEHKNYPSFAGPFAPRSDASRCPPSLSDADALTDWLRVGIESGDVGAPWEGDFPRYVWYRTEEACFEARLMNREAGEYKGYPLAPEERPDWL